jgi:putative transposase
MDERLRFVARLLEGEKMAELCREFEISRKTGYKIFNRYKDTGLEGLTDRSRKPFRQARQLPFQIENEILSIKRGRQRRYRAEGTALSLPTEPNDLWCADYKGEFMLADGRYCYPLTVTDFASRYLIGCEALSNTRTQYAVTVFERLFREYGLPKTIRTDNGTPFASGWALFGLTTLSVWWLRLGIALERIKPGRPQQNGRHERMHLTLKKEATKPAGKNLLQQQARFDTFVDEFNQVRPHQALDMKTPSELYRPSPRPYTGIGELDYPFHDKAITITRCGRLCIDRKKISLSKALAGQTVGVKEISESVWLVSFMHYDLGFFDHESSHFECAPNPFDAKVLPMSPE